MKRIGILANPALNGVSETVGHLVSLAKNRGIGLVLAEDLKGICDAAGSVFCPRSELKDRVDLLIALGGDGTILRAAREVRSAGTPILGVNLGRLGFLAGADPGTLEESFERLYRGEFLVEDRMAITARTGAGGQAFALNEIVIERAVTARMIQVKTWIGNASLSSFFGNGLIVATPTGSTGYNLSAGGPVIHPGMPALIVTPICPHMLALRSVVVPGDQGVRVETAAEHSDIMLTADGQTVGGLEPGTSVWVERADVAVRMVHLEGLPFYGLLRRKLDWSLDLRERKE